MSNKELIKYLKAQLKQVEDELSKPHERTDGAYLMGKKIVLIDVLEKLERPEPNPDCQEPTVFDKMLVEGFLMLC